MSNHQNVLVTVAQGDIVPSRQHTIHKTRQGLRVRRRMLAWIAPKTSERIGVCRHEFRGGLSFPGAEVHFLNPLIQGERNRVSLRQRLSKRCTTYEGRSNDAIPWRD